MKEKKIYSNIIYSCLIQLSAIIAPLITTPYVARVFNPDLIGKYSYTYANSNYFTMIECLGLTLYGTIEIAKIRDDKQKRSKVFWEIAGIKFFLTVGCTLIYIFVFLYLGNAEYHKLYLVMILNLWAVGLDISWFLNGLEEFRTTAIRSVLVRIINIILILAFVKTSNDLLKYAIIMQGCTFVSYILLFSATKNKICFISLKKLEYIGHLKKSMVYFVPGLITTLFASTDKTILGALSTTYEVGLYDQAYKICQLLAGMISAVSNALLPRATYLNSNQETNEAAKKLFKNSIVIGSFLAFPVCFGVAAISNSFVMVFLGNEYEKSAVLLRILCINVFFIAMSNFFGQQSLMARGKQKEYNISIIVSVIINIILNLILVNKLKAVGVCIASAVSGIVEFAMIYYYGRDMLTIKEIKKNIYKYLFSTLLMFVAVYPITIINQWITVIMQITLGIVIYIAMLLILKDELISSVLTKKRRKINN